MNSKTLTVITLWSNITYRMITVLQIFIQSIITVIKKQLPTVHVESYLVKHFEKNNIYH